MAGLKTPSSLCLTVFWKISVTELENAVATCDTNGKRFCADYKKKYPQFAEQIESMQHRKLPNG